MKEHVVSQNKAHHIVSALSEVGVYVSGLVNHKKVPILLDTGSTVSVLSKSTWHTCGVYKPSSHRKISGCLSTANGTELKVMGEFDLLIVLGGRQFTVPMLIADGLTHSCLLGSDFSFNLVALFPMKRVS